MCLNVRAKHSRRRDITYLPFRWPLAAAVRRHYVFLVAGLALGAMMHLKLLAIEVNDYRPAVIFMDEAETTDAEGGASPRRDADKSMAKVK